MEHENLNNLLAAKSEFLQAKMKLEERGPTFVKWLVIEQNATFDIKTAQQVFEADAYSCTSEYLHSWD